VYTYSLFTLGHAVIASNVGLSMMVAILVYIGPGIVSRHYLVPYLVCEPSSLEQSDCPLHLGLAYKPLVCAATPLYIACQYDCISSH
jgi:hypothetical protein